MKRDNVVAVLCDDIDNSLTNITNIKDVVLMDATKTASFDVAVFVNGIEWNIERFGLYYFIENIKEKSMAYIGCTEFVNNGANKKGSNGKHRIGTRDNCSQTIAKVKVVDISFLGTGAHELQVYKYEENNMPDLAGKSNEECVKYAKDDKLVTTYAFEVEYSN